MASRRYGPYVVEDERGRPQLGYKGGWIIESCFRIKQTGLQVRPMFHGTPRRIEAHVKLCVSVLQVQRAAEVRCQLPWTGIAMRSAG